MLEEGLGLLFTPRMMHHLQDEEAPESPSTNMELQDTHIHIYTQMMLLAQRRHETGDPTNGYKYVPCEKKISSGPH